MGAVPLEAAHFGCALKSRALGRCVDAAFDDAVSAPAGSADERLGQPLVKGVREVDMLHAGFRRIEIRVFAPPGVVEDLVGNHQSAR